MSLSVLIFLIASAPESLVRHEALVVHSVTPSATSVTRYARLDLTIDLAATYENPFDPEDIDVWAEFTPPNGAPVRVNGFWTQNCARKLTNNCEFVEPTGDPFWQIRFTPTLEGVWRYQVFAKDRSGKTASNLQEFTVTPSDHPGFIRLNKRSPHIFTRDNTSPFFAIGENMCWGDGRGTYTYDDWLSALGKAGGNWIRLWMYRWHCGIEWSAEDKRNWDSGTFGGLGVYNLCNAWKLDRILDTAEDNGIQVMLCLGTYGEFTTGGFFNEGIWNTNPYNAANGGPCAKPEDFWTNETARNFYKQRLRYLAARNGWRTNLFAWEFWNEAYPTPEWVAEMTGFLKGGADPFGHLVSTTYGKADIWNLPSVDFTMTHHYGESNIADTAPVAITDARQHRAFGKPHFLAEFGIDWRSSDDKRDPEYKGINLHNGLWASLAAGNAGTGMLWYWDTYIHPGNLYTQFTPVRRFSDQVPWNEGPWNPLQMDPPQAVNAPGSWRDVFLSPVSSWEKCAIPEFTIDPIEGTGGKPLPKFLFGPWKPELRVPLVLKVNYEQAGRFEVCVGNVSTLARLAITLDGNPLKEVRLSAQPQGPDNPTPEYESTELKTEYNSYFARFRKNYGIDVPAGAHTITVDVTDGDWADISDYVFKGYVSGRFVNVNRTGLTNGTTAVLWVQNAAHNWLNVANNVSIAPVPESHVGIHGLADGDYKCLWWDTWKGEPIKVEPVKSTGGLLDLKLPELAKDVAVLIAPPKGESK